MIILKAQMNGPLAKREGGTNQIPTENPDNYYYCNYKYHQYYHYYYYYGDDNIPSYYYYN